MNSPQTLGQTVVLSLETYFLEIKNQKHFEKLKAYHHFLTSLRFPLRSLTPPTLRLKGVSDTELLKMKVVVVVGRGGKKDKNNKIIRCGVGSKFGGISRFAAQGLGFKQRGCK